MSPSGQKSKKNSLTIRLTESAVFLRTDGDTGRRRHNENTRSSMLRGLLTLDLVKPTKISSIEIDLTAKTSTAWPEGVGARRIEVTEEHRVFHASTVYFRAGKADHRRAASIGPGIAYPGDDTLFDEDDGSSQSHTPVHQNRETREDESPEHELPRGRPGRFARRVSMDSSAHYQRTPVSHTEEFDLAPIPPYSPFASSPGFATPDRPHLSPAASLRRLTSSLGQDVSPALSLEEFRNSLHSSLRAYQHNQTSPTTSAYSLRLRERSSSRRPNMEGVPEHEHEHEHEHEPGHEPEAGPSTPRQRSPRSRTPPGSYFPAVSPTETAAVSPTETTTRGRKGSRFSFHSLMDAVRSSSPIAGKPFARSRERSGDPVRRGRTRERREDTEIVEGSSATAPRRKEPSTRESRERITALGRVSEILKLDLEEKKDKEAGDGWKEFKKGTYTYPISFAIPGNSPPTMQCDYGSVTWRLRAQVHRPGAFKTKLSATREVITIACPTEEDTEDTENIIVERHWDQQLQYLISISGRSFYIGGTVPVTFTMMPLAKVKIHRISVFIEERVDYYTHMRRIARTDPISRIDLLTLKGEGKGADPILPLDSDDPDAFKHSPLYGIVSPDADISEMASSLMGPGPWTFHQDLILPASCALTKFTNKNRRSNIVVTHLLKCVMRVERGDDLHVDPKTGKRKLFDIVVQTPVHILSCRCNPEWTSLPRYSETLDDPQVIGINCPCQAKRLANGQGEFYPSFRAHLPTLERMTSRHSSDSSASMAETSPVNPVLMRSLRQHQNMVNTSSQFERLISGQESEIGEAPPAYDATVVVA